MIIQIFLISGFLIFLFYVLANPASSHIRAWTKILATLFVVVAIITVLIPNSTNAVAHFMGIQRGADLLLYVLSLAFIFVMFSSYMQEKRMQQKIVSLGRKIAIMEANEEYKHKKSRQS